ncbi:predicted protein [Sclerotinia sclerotiorum 1980 UF-70]|uniref:Uncharacterized protein n=1 Tax=Sclerotinia sclerotiorum (strain ATCC 18683 / 1980 / Ss-1) TaxID=665079 RepID=A7EJB2_SCLS1|nr:predicted protein [Sclerotinia sclerotiorum 1980 UF-70]EDO02928.1 predicted protein [Sclerotinia sclerotiorum 1980 UF-70]
MENPKMVRKVEGFEKFYLTGGGFKAVPPCA